MGGNRERERDSHSHLAHSVRVAFGMTPISVPGAPSQQDVDDGMVMDMEMDVDPSERHSHAHSMALPPLQMRAGNSTSGGMIPSLSDMMSRSEPNSRKASVSPKMSGDAEGEEVAMGSPPNAIELPPLLLSEQKVQLPSSLEDEERKPAIAHSGARLPGSRLDLNSLA